MGADAPNTAVCYAFALEEGSGENHPMETERRISLMEIIASIVMVSVLTSLVVPWVITAPRRSKFTSCAAHLSSLYKMTEIYSSQVSRRLDFRQLRGKKLWTWLVETEPPILQGDEAQFFSCPVKGTWQSGRMDYLGPSRKVNNLVDGDPVACDEESNHSWDGSEGGNVLLKSGAVVEDKAELWKRCIKEKECVP